MLVLRVCAGARMGGRPWSCESRSQGTRIPWWCASRSWTSYRTWSRSSTRHAPVQRDVQSNTHSLWFASVHILQHGRGQITKRCLRHRLQLEVDHVRFRALRNERLARRPQHQQRQGRLPIACRAKRTAGLRHLGSIGSVRWWPRAYGWWGRSPRAPCRQSSEKAERERSPPARPRAG